MAAKSGAQFWGTLVINNCDLSVEFLGISNAGKDNGIRVDNKPRDRKAKDHGEQVLVQQGKGAAIIIQY